MHRHLVAIHGLDDETGQGTHGLGRRGRRDRKALLETCDSIASHLVVVVAQVQCVVEILAIADRHRVAAARHPEAEPGVVILGIEHIRLRPEEGTRLVQECQVVVRLGRGHADIILFHIA